MRRLIHYLRVAYAWILRHLVAPLIPALKDRIAAQDRHLALMEEIGNKIKSGKYEASPVFRKEAVSIADRVRNMSDKPLPPWRWSFIGLVLRAVNARRRRTRQIMELAGANYESGRQRRKFRKGFNRALRAKRAAALLPKPTIVGLSGVAAGGSGAAV